LYPLTGTPAITAIDIDFIRATVIAVSWTSTLSVSYDLLLTAAGVVVLSTNTNDTGYSFNGLTNGTLYGINVVPRNEICQGVAAELNVTAGVMPIGMISL